MEREFSQDYEESEQNRDSMPPAQPQENMNPYIFEERQRMVPEFPDMRGMNPQSHGVRRMNPYQHQMVVTLNDLSSMLDENK